jgi:hypothetical protein
MIQMWLNIFPMPSLVVSKITSLCRNFLWSGNPQSNKSALVAWKQVCLPLNERGSGILDIAARNKCFLARQLWNIHLKSDSLWIRWVHHFYLTHGTIWSSRVHKISSPLWKAILLLKDQLLNDCGGNAEVVNTLQMWHNDERKFIANAHEHFRFKGPTVH